MIFSLKSVQLTARLMEAFCMFSVALDGVLIEFSVFA